MSTPLLTDTSPAQPVTVYYDGSCPLCRSEIGLYRNCRGAETLDFVDVSKAGSTEAAGLDRETAMQRFHVADSDGRLVSGGRAFAALWLALPGWRWLGRLFSSRIGGAVIDAAYRAFLPVRPLLQRLARRRG